MRRDLRFSGSGVSILEYKFCNEPVHGDAEGLIGVPDVVIPSEVDS